MTVPQALRSVADRVKQRSEDPERGDSWISISEFVRVSTLVEVIEEVAEEFEIRNPS